MRVKKITFNAKNPQATTVEIDDADTMLTLNQIEDKNVKTINAGRILIKVKDGGNIIEHFEPLKDVEVESTTNFKADDKKSLEKAEKASDKDAEEEALERMIGNLLDAMFGFDNSHPPFTFK